MNSFLYIAMVISSDIACYIIAKRKNIDPPIWVVLTTLFGPIIIIFLLLKKSKPPRLFASREEAYEAFLEEEKEFNKFTYKSFHIIARIFGGLLLFSSAVFGYAVFLEITSNNLSALDFYLYISFPIFLFILGILMLVAKPVDAKKWNL